MRLSGDLAREYSEAIAPHHRACNHPRHHRCARRNAEVDQCLECGAQIGGAFPKSQGFASLPSWIADLQDRFDQGRSAAIEKIRRSFIAKARGASEQQKAQRKAAALSYAAYLRTAEWQLRRSLVLKRAGGICEGCMLEKATEVHHKHYDHAQNELLYDLVALCRGCHMKAHPEHHEQEYYEDYSVCANCRFNGDGIQCHKFDVEVFRAFSPGGGCCPPGSAAEDLK